MNIKLISHRTTAGHATENSLQGIHKATDFPVDMVEFDIRKTKDDFLVLHHDPIIDRTTDNKGSISEYTYEELKEMRLEQSRHPIPLLTHALEILPLLPFDYQIELKEKESTHKFLTLLNKDYDIDNQIQVVSFDIGILKEIPNYISTGLFTAHETTIQKSYVDDERTVNISSNPVESALDIGVDWIGFENEYANRELLEKAKQSGFNTGVWTVNNQSLIAHKPLIDTVTTDYPDRFSSISD